MINTIFVFLLEHQVQEKKKEKSVKYLLADYVGCGDNISYNCENLSLVDTF